MCLGLILAAFKVWNIPCSNSESIELELNIKVFLMRLGAQFLESDAPFKKPLKKCLSVWYLGNRCFVPLGLVILRGRTDNIWWKTVYLVLICSPIIIILVWTAGCRHLHSWTVSIFLPSSAQASHPIINFDFLSITIIFTNMISKTIEFSSGGSP